MKNFRILCFIAFFTFLGFNGFAQESKSENNQETVQTTFSVEINADTTLEDLKKIEQMLKDDYNVEVNFENVKIVDNKIVSIRMKLVNENQSFMKSIDNVNRPIDPFSINLTASENGKHYVSLKGNTEKNPLNFFGSDAFSAFDSFSDDRINLHSEFSSFSDELEQMYQQMQASQQRFQELFKNFREETAKSTNESKNNSNTKSNDVLK